jgi:phosphoribosylaminoimidazole-succinocarboxamide synthase
MTGIMQTNLQSLHCIYQGKVRDLYAIDDQTMLMVATDRLSAFDVVFNEPIPDKGKILTALSQFWFTKLAHIVPHHLTGIDPKTVVSPSDWPQIEGRSIVVKRLQPIAIEAIVRGYLVGSGFKDYQISGQLCGLALPLGLKEAERLPQAIFTPSSKAAVGQHDENISFAQCTTLLGVELANKVKQTALCLYEAAAEYALSRDIIIADTKFEFGLDETGELVLMDEVLTPDSSRFWPATQYESGRNQPSFDKQFVREWLESIAWDKAPPAPALPEEIARKTAEKYQQALRILTHPR